MITIPRILGLTTIVALLLASTSGEGFSWYSFYDEFSIKFVLVGALGIMLIGTEMHDWKSAAQVVLRHAAREDEATRRSATHWFRMAARSTVSVGLIAYFLSLTAMLSNLDDPSSIGSGVAVAMLPLLYGLVLSEFLFNPLAASLENRSENDPSPPRSFSFLTFVAVITILTIAIMLLSTMTVAS